MNLTDKTKARFLSKVIIGPADECWGWLGSFYKTGYGQFTVKRGTCVAAHRVAWVIANKRSIPGSLCVCHTCDNKACVNPHHLWIGSNAENRRDAKVKGRLNVPHPTLQKLTDAQLDDIRLLLAHGAPQVLLAKHFGVSAGWISLYANRLRRQHPLDLLDAAGRLAVNL